MKGKWDRLRSAAHPAREALFAQVHRRDVGERDQETVVVVGPVVEVSILAPTATVVPEGITFQAEKPRGP